MSTDRLPEEATKKAEVPLETRFQVISMARSTIYSLLAFKVLDMAMFNSCRL